MERNSKSISVVVINTVNNTEENLIRCLNSVANQTYKNIEVVLVNKSSTTNLDKIINLYNDDKLQIKVIEVKADLGQGKGEGKVIDLLNALGERHGIGNRFAAVLG